jgi:hypothetical protein
VGVFENEADDALEGSLLQVVAGVQVAIKGDDSKC